MRTMSALGLNDRTAKAYSGHGPLDAMKKEAVTGFFLWSYVVECDLHDLDPA